MDILFVGFPVLVDMGLGLLLARGPTHVSFLNEWAGLDMGLSSAGYEDYGSRNHSFPHRSLVANYLSPQGLLVANSQFTVARRRATIATIYPTPLSELRSSSGHICMATLENFSKLSIISPKGLLNKMTLASGIRCTVGVASQPSLLTLQLFISPNFSLTATTLESGLESQPASFGFMSHASNYTGAKGVDLFGLPTQQ